MKDDLFVVCVLEHEYHTPESKLDICSKCRRKVWCSPWNMHLKKICIYCLDDIPGEKQFTIKRKDAKRAKEVIDG